MLAANTALSGKLRGKRAVQNTQLNISYLSFSFVFKLQQWSRVVLLHCLAPCLRSGVESDTTVLQHVQAAAVYCFHKRDRAALTPTYHPCTLIPVMLKMSLSQTVHIICLLL